MIKMVIKMYTNFHYTYIYFFVVIAFAIVLGIIAYKKNKKMESQLNELIKNNEFIAKKRDKYEQIINNNAASIADEKKDYQKYGILFGILALIPLVLFVIFHHYIFMILFTIVFIIGAVIVGKKMSAYSVKAQKMYNETAKEILKELNPDLEYYPDRGYLYQEYNSLHFYEECDRFYSEDMIINNKTGFTSADIIVESEHEDDDGHKYYSTEYEGSLARIDIKNIGCNIILGGLSKYTSMKYVGFNKIMFEHDEFNKEFLCFTDNELIAYKVLTPDIMEELVNIKKNTIGDINVRIMNNKLYIRFSGTNGFDGKEDSKDELFLSVVILEEIMKTMDNIKKIIEKKNMD